METNVLLFLFLELLQNLKCIILNQKEALAIYWSIKRLYTYLYGRKFLLIFDNKPVTHIFAPDKKLPIMSATSLVHYTSFLSSLRLYY